MSHIAKILVMGVVLTLAFCAARRHLTAGDDRELKSRTAYAAKERTLRSFTPERKRQA